MPIITKDGVTMILCTRGHKKVAKCHWCAKPSVALCDFEIKVGDVGHKHTCDKPMCEDHRTPVGKNVDHCPSHTGENF